MNDNLLQIMINAKDNATSVMKTVGSSIDSVQDKATRLKSQGLKAMSDGFDNVIDKAKQLVAGLAVAGVAITGLGFATASSFEAQISSIKALTGASESQVQTIQDLALQLGKDTKFSALEAAQGIEELLKAGVSLDNVINGGVAGALDLAAAGEISVAEAAEMASVALNAFRDDNMSVSDAANILAGAANASATSVGELKYGLSAVAAVASGLGMSFDDTSTALAVFAQNGLKGSDAGTSLKTMLLNLQPGTKAQKELFDQLGITTDGMNNKFFDSEGKIQDLSNISGTLQAALAGLTDQQRLQALETLFGSDAIRAANILYKEGEEGILAMNEAMQAFTAADVAAEKMNNLNGTLDNLKSTVETLFIQVFLPLLPMITPLIDDLIVSLNGLDTGAITLALESMIRNFIGFGIWIIQNGQLIVGVLAVLGGAFSGLGVGMGLMNAAAWAGVPAGTALSSTLYAIATAAWTAFAPFLPFIAIGAAIVGVLYLMKMAFDQNLFGIKDITSDFLNWMGENWSKFYSWLSEGTLNNLIWLLEMVTKSYVTWQTITAEFWYMLGDIFDGNTQAIAERLVKWGRVIKQIMDDAWNYIKDAAESAFLALLNSIGQTFTNIVNTIANSINFVIKKINDLLGSEAAQKLLGGIGNGIRFEEIQTMTYTNVVGGGGGGGEAPKWNEMIADIFKGMGDEAMAKAKRFEETTGGMIDFLKKKQNDELKAVSNNGQTGQYDVQAEIQKTNDAIKQAQENALEQTKSAVKDSEKVTNQPGSIIQDAKKSGGSTTPKKEESQEEKDLKILKAQLAILKEKANEDIEALRRQKELLQYEEAKARLQEEQLVLDTVKSDEIQKQIKELEDQKFIISQLDPTTKEGRLDKDNRTEELARILRDKKEELSIAKEQEQLAYNQAKDERDKLKTKRDLEQLEIDRQIKLRQDRLADESKPLEQRIQNITINVQTLPGQSNEDIAQEVSRILAEQYAG